VIEDRITQVLTKTNGARRFIEDMKQRAQREERHSGVEGGVTSSHLRISKEALEKLKSGYLQLFMDRDLAIKFVEDKEGEVEELRYQLSLVRTSPLTVETPSDLAAMIQAGVSVMHDMREEPLVTSSNEEHSESSVLKRSHDLKSLDCTHRDHEPFLLESTLEAQEIVEHLPCRPSHKEVYVSTDWVDRYMTGMDILRDAYTAIISRILGSVAHTRHQVVQENTMVCDNMQGSSWAYSSGQWSFEVFPLGRPPDRGLKHTLDLRLPKIGEWMGEPRGEAYTSMIKLHRGCQQMRIREPDTHGFVPTYHREILVMPLGLTDTLVTLQFCRKLSRQLVSTLFDPKSDLKYSKISG
jgi:hypothetical protein